MKRLSTLLTVGLLSLGSLSAQTQLCGNSVNNIFNAGEEIRYKVFYNISAAWVGAGEAVFTTTSSTFAGKPVYHIVGKGSTYSSYDWVFKVRDTYESYIDKTKMVPLRFKRDVNEGKTSFKNDVTFNHSSSKATSNGKQFSITACTQDVLSTIYFARSVDYNKYKPGDKIPFSLFLDDELHSLYIRYGGKTKVTTKYGTFNAIKLTPLLVKGTIFKGGEQMIVYVSDDQNHIPLRIESPILVGSIKVDLYSYKNLKYPMTSKIK